MTEMMTLPTFETTNPTTTETKRADYTLLTPTRNVTGLRFKEAWALTQRWVANGETSVTVFRNGVEVAEAGAVGWQYLEPRDGDGLRCYVKTPKLVLDEEQLTADETDEEEA